MNTYHISEQNRKFMQAQPFKSQGAIQEKSQSPKWEIIRREVDFDPEPSRLSAMQNMYVKPITVTDKKPHKLTITMNESDYERLQKLFDFIGTFESLDQMVRQQLLQPEMHLAFTQFMGIVGPEGVNFTAQNSPEGFGWY